MSGKRFFKSRFFKSRFFKSGHWAGVGAPLVVVPGIEQRAPNTRLHQKAPNTRLYAISPNSQPDGKQQEE